MNKASRTQRSNGASAVGCSKLGSFILLSIVAILLAIFALALTPSFAQNRTEGNSTGVKPPQQLSLKLSPSKSSVSSCPGEGAAARVQLTTSGLGAMGRMAQYDWKVSGGFIEGKGASVTWSLSGAKPGIYSASVTATINTLIAVHSASSQTQVIVERCQADLPTCPQMSLSCDQTITAGSQGKSRVAWKGGTPGVNPTYLWSATAGRIVRGQGTREIVFDTTGADGQTITLMLELGGFGRRCRTSCRMFVQPLVKDEVTPTPTPTITPPPTQTPTPTLSPSPSAVASASSSPSPVVTTTTSTDASPSDTSGAQRRIWPWLLLAALVALLAGALLLAKLSSFTLKGRVAGSPKSLPPATPYEQGMGGVLMGGLKDAGDEVHCTVFAPEQAAPGDSFQVQVFAHLAEQAGQLAAMAAKADEAARDRGSKLLSERIERETKLTFILMMPDLEVQGNGEESLIWHGVVDYVQFAVDVPANFKQKKVNGVVKIYCGDEKAPVGKIMFTFKVVDAGTPQPVAAASAPAPPPQKLIKYTHAFISYCSKDRRRVLMGIQGLRRGWKRAGITDFIDLQDIESGEHWREVIQTNLDKCDLFVLFWSSAAQCSEEVRKEINYALARKGGSDENPPTFEPFTIELPLPQPLPDGLESQHFGDELLYLIKAEETLEAERAKRSTTPDAETGQD